MYEPIWCMTQGLQTWGSTICHLIVWYNDTVFVILANVPTMRMWTIIGHVHGIPNEFAHLP
jgi:hypothetical protein